MHNNLLISIIALSLALAPGLAAAQSEPDIPGMSPPAFELEDIGDVEPPGSLEQELDMPVFEDDIQIEIETTEDLGEPPMDDLLQKIEDSEMTAQPEVSPQPEVVDQGVEVPVPQEEALSTPPPVSRSASAPDSGGAVPDMPALETEDPIDENIFFDAESLVPAGEMGAKAGPKKVNPRLQPASKLVVVRKNHSPQSREAKLVSAKRAIQLGRYDSALLIYDELYARNKRDVNVLMGRAVALQHLGRDDAAIRAYEELLEYHPNDVEAQVNMLGLIGARYPAVALTRLDELYAENQSDIRILAQMAVIHASMGQYDEALQYLGIAASMEPQNANHLYNIAVIADRAGKRKEAVDYYEKALEADTIYGGGRTIPRDAVFVRLAQLR